MKRVGLALLTFAAMLMTVSGDPAVLGLGGLVGGVVGGVLGTVSSLVKTVAGFPCDTRSIIVILKGDTSAVIAAAADHSTDMWTELKRQENIRNITDALKAHAQQSQGPLIQLLLQVTGLVFKSNWISNTVQILDCPVALVQTILALDFVHEIIYDIIFELHPIQPTADSPSNTATAGWGPTKIKATNVWTSYRGQNVVVGTIDTGVRSTHEVLQSNFIGAYGWYDPELKTSTPYDANGHGTHTLATIVGKQGVGVAPDAKWMSCKGCGATSCKLSLLQQCGQFMMCPTDTNGNNGNPAKAPHIVSNSWGVGQGMTYYQSILDAWEAARILPVFAAGNSGASGCGTVVSPGDSTNAFAVGATDTNDNLAAFSSRGPGINGVMKPDISGPGVAIRSAWNGNNSDYMSLSGTSMAAPHLAGTIALALSARPGFCFDTMKAVLTGSNDRNLPTAPATCGGTLSSTYPNNQYGYGRMNAEKVVNSAIAY